MIEANLISVTGFAVLTALTTGLGALPFFFVEHMKKNWLGYSAALAAGIMLSASYNLIYEGFMYGEYRTLLGILAGVVFIAVTNSLLEKRNDIGIENLEGAGAREALLILGIMTLHSFAEGAGVGVSFGDGGEFGVFISLAIAVHNIPEGLAISLVMVPRGVRPWKAALWSIFSSLPQPLVAVPAFLFVQVFRPALPFGLGLAGGAMIWMVFAELVPDAMEHIGSKTAASIASVAVLGMTAFQIITHY